MSDKDLRDAVKRACRHADRLDEWARGSGVDAVMSSRDGDECGAESYAWQAAAQALDAAAIRLLVNALGDCTACQRTSDGRFLDGPFA